MNRRNFIKKLGVGLGVATVAPALLLSAKDHVTRVRRITNGKLVTDKVSVNGKAWMPYEQYRFMLDYRHELEQSAWANHKSWINSKT